MKCHTACIALAASIIGAILFCLPEQASKLSGGRKLAEAAGVIVERTCCKTQKSLMTFTHQQSLQSTRNPSPKKV